MIETTRVSDFENPDGLIMKIKIVLRISGAKYL
jgi:hypothetical protein